MRRSLMTPCQILTPCQNHVDTDHLMILDGHVAQTGFENTTKTIEKYYNHGNMLYHKNKNGKYIAYRVAVSLAHLLPPTSRISQSLSEVRVLHTSAQTHAENAREKASTDRHLKTFGPSSRRELCEILHAVFLTCKSSHFNPCPRSRKTDRIVLSSITHNTTAQKRGACVCVQGTGTGSWRIPIESSMMPA